MGKLLDPLFSRGLTQYIQDPMGAPTPAWAAPTPAAGAPTPGPSWSAPTPGVWEDYRTPGDFGAGGLPATPGFPNDYNEPDGELLPCISAQHFTHFL